MEAGNGLSAFATDTETPADLVVLIRDYFKLQEGEPMEKGGHFTL